MRFTKRVADLSRKAFTLIEMLTLILLMGLLLAILMPALAQSRTQAQTSKCASNLRQIALLRAGNVQSDRWGNSPYDIGDSGWDSRSERSGGGTLGDGGSRGDTGGDIDDDFVFDERAEMQAVEEPAGWSLLCPLAERDGQNSYGIRITACFVPYERTTSRDVVMGCSEYKVVDVVRNFALRHNECANFLFGDMRVATHGLEVFTRDEISARSNRMPPNHGAGGRRRIGG